MTERILDLSEKPARLKVRYGQLVIRRDGAPDATVPLVNLAVLIAANAQVSYTNAVLSGLAAAGGVFITCDEKHHPVGMLIPLVGHFVQTERFARQAGASLPTRKRLWQQIVRSKIRAQARLLRKLYGKDYGVATLQHRVKSGDPQNAEAQAARRYWPVLFADKNFRRDFDAEDQNRYLNYGYAVLRAVVARAVCAAGLHPSLGLHHHNRYNAFCLADDLLEPLRPIADEAAVQIADKHGSTAPLNRTVKGELLEFVIQRYIFEGESRTLFDIVSRMASSLAAVFNGERKDLVIPEI